MEIEISQFQINVKNFFRRKVQFTFHRDQNIFEKLILRLSVDDVKKYFIPRKIKFICIKKYLQNLFSDSFLFCILIVSTEQFLLMNSQTNEKTKILHENFREVYK